MVNLNIKERNGVGERIYVGNLPFKTTDDELRQLFETYGTVEQADVIRYKKSGRSKGYAFVIINDGAAEGAVEALHNNKYEERVLKVKVAKARANFPQSAEEQEVSAAAV